MSKKRPNFDQIPLFVPQSEWKPPTELPDLRRAERLSIDVETRDDRRSRGYGPGWAFGEGYVAGVAVAWDGGQVYVPIRHPDTACFDREQVARWLRDTLASEGMSVVTYHGSYDWGWLIHDFKVPWPAHLDDAEALAVFVDENRLSYKLAEICKWRSVPGKDETLLNDSALVYGIPKGKVKENLWRLPARYVGPYAESDACANLALLDDLTPVLRQEGTYDAYRTEMDLVPMVHLMRQRGIRVDLDAAERAKAHFLEKRDHAIREVSSLCKEKLTIGDLRRTKVLERLHDAHNIEYPPTATGQGSFTDEWMADHEHDLPRLCSEAQRYDAAANKFVDDFIMKHAHRGRLHASINQFKGESGGTRSHRFSYSDPPLQQMPAREEEVAALIRGCFLPEEGEQWLAADYSQQEYRLIVHFAELTNQPKASVAADLYRSDPETDFHQVVMDWTGLERKPAKNTNFAKAFGAGLKKFAKMIKRSDSEAQEIFDVYSREFPFVDALARMCQRKAETRGFIRMIDGARNHFDLWEPADWNQKGVTYGARPRHLAEEAWPGKRLRRAGCHKAMNRLIQGSAARQTKIAMLACFRAGHVPLLQMHDELDFSVSSHEQVRDIHGIMTRTASNMMSVPALVDIEVGPSWGAVAKEHPYADVVCSGADPRDPGGRSRARVRG